MLRISGTPGGDSGAVTLELDAGALTDPAHNQNLVQTNIEVVETADTIPPIAESATPSRFRGMRSWGTRVPLLIAGRPNLEEF